jgi:hypothetical protein
MGVAVSSDVNDNIAIPICTCFDDCVKYILHGCNSECGLSKCCTCNVEVVNHSADDFEVTETEVINYYFHLDFSTIFDFRLASLNCSIIF